MKPSGYTGVVEYGGEPGSNGLLLDSQGRVVFCEHGDRRVSRLEKDGGKKTLADSYAGKRLNSPNDAVYKSNGRFLLHGSTVRSAKEFRRPPVRSSISAASIGLWPMAR